MQRKPLELSQQQHLLKQKAKQHQQRLLSLRQQKLSLFRQQLKDQLTSDIQSKYQNFKLTFESYSQSQLDSLALQKELKINDIRELEETITAAIENLKGKVNSLRELKVELVNSAEEAVAHLELNSEIRRKEARQQRERQLRARVEEFEQSVFIE